MRTNPFYDTWLFLIGQTGDQQSLGIVRWFLVALLALLLVSGLVIAIQNWREDPDQRTGTHVVTWFARTLVGCMWYQGMLWKLPLLTKENGLFFWTSQMVEHAAFQFHRDFVSQVILPAFLYVDPLVFLAELGFAISLILGFGVRIAGIVAVAFVANLWLGLYRHPGEWPWNYVFLAFLMGGFSLHAAGRSLGLDAMLRRRAAASYGRGSNFILTAT